MFCRYCGNQISEGAGFCRWCGKPTSVNANNLKQAPAGGYYSPQIPEGAAVRIKNKKPVNKPLLCGALLVTLCVFLIVSGIILIPRSVSAARKGKKNVSKADTEKTELLLQEETAEDYFPEIPDTYDQETE